MSIAYMKTDSLMVHASTRNFPIIKTIFNEGSDYPHSLLYSGFIHNALMRLLPSYFFLDEKRWEENPEGLISALHNMLPLFKWNEWEGSTQHISVFLVHLYRHNTVKFFHEMISRWLLPCHRINISSFFAVDFQIPQLTSEMYTFCEMAISLESASQRDLVRRQLPIIESEIKLGLVSVYHANRILEIKGLSADEKTSSIQERIASFLKKSPKDLDYDIFSQMQHFLVMCTEEFKSERNSHHMTRIIYVFYLFHKMLRGQAEKEPEHRFVFVKLSKTHLHLPLGMKKVLCLHIGLNFLSDNEMFEHRHIIRVLHTLCPEVRAIEESYFARSFKETKIHLLYLEIEKIEGGDFSLDELRALRTQLPDAVRNGVEKLKRPVFMPRNEEEVMRSIITLSQQLHYSKDLPQVTISFDEQTELELSFTIILLRILNGAQPSVQKLFEEAKTHLKFIPDRVKNLGLFRKKYVKEATVFRVAIPSLDFIRSDHSIDLFKARKEVLNELQRIVGEVRDYNGGMIAKQHEQFVALKSLFPLMDKPKELLLENVFHSIFPVELRSVLEPAWIKIFFTLLLKLMEEKKEGYLSKRKKDALFWVFSHRDASVKQIILNAVDNMHLPSSQLITISLPISEAVYFGCIFRETDRKKQENFLMRLKEMASKSLNLTTVS